MRTENINQSYSYVTNTDNVPNADSPVATLKIPAGQVYRLQNGVPLILKLYNTTGNEINNASEVYLAWQAPVGKTIFQAGRTMNYGIFARISLADQENIDTQGRRLIEFDDDEIARAAAGKESILTGLTSDYKIMLMVNSSDTVDVSNANYQFNFDAKVLTEQEFDQEKKPGSGLVLS